jgi:conjugal transfer ATP-binding protein TraC
LHSFDNKSGNFNTCYVGRSGSGKSVLMQEAVTCLLGLGGNAFVLDVGRSFEKQVKFFGGQFIEFSTNSNLCLNPFSSINNESPEHIADSLSMLKPIISLMVAPKRGTTDEEDSIIEQGLTSIWELEGRNGSINALAEWFLSDKDSIANNLGKMLFPYTNKGAYGRFFNGPSTIDFESKFVVAELQELKERKDLQSVVVQIFMLLITNKIMLGNRLVPSSITFDEAWDLLRGKQSGDFIEALARTLRKFNGSLGVGTQTVNDFYSSPGAEAAFNNSDWLYMLSQKKESIELLKKSGRFLVDDYTQKLLSSVTTKQGEYSEVMVIHERGSAIVRLLLDPFSRVLYSTKAEEYAQVRNYEAQGLSLRDAIARVAKEKFKDAL